MLTLQPLAPHVHYLPPDHATDRPLLGVVSGSRGSLLVDAGASAAHTAILLAEMQRLNLPAPRYLALTHWHWDHVFGAASLDLPTFASELTTAALQKMARMDWSDAALDARVAQGHEIAFCRDMLKLELPDPSQRSLRPPDFAFNDRVTLDLGGVTAQLAFLGGDHSPDGSVVFVPGDGVVFLGDITSDDIYHGEPRLTTAGLFPLLDRLLDFDAAWYLHGHALEPISRLDFAADCALLQTIGRLVEQVGPHRESALLALTGVLGVSSLTEDHIEIANSFLNGLARPLANPIPDLWG